MIKLILPLFLFFTILSIILFIITKKEKSSNPGYKILNNIIPQNDIQNILKDWEVKDFKKIHNYFMNNDKIKNMINNELSQDYRLIDYIYIIENSAIHTYHRDYTSSQMYNNLSFPSYTMILYLDDSNNGLNVIPNSHINTLPFYLFDHSIKLNVQKGSMILFDANLLHSGSAISKNTKRKCIQFKIIHKDDIQKLPHLQKFHVMINKPNDKNAIFKYIETEFTKHFPIFMDLFQSVIKTSFGKDKTFIQKLVSQIVFSDKDFYKPINF